MALKFPQICLLLSYLPLLTSYLAYHFSHNSFLAKFCACQSGSYSRVLVLIFLSVGDVSLPHTHRLVPSSTWTLCSSITFWTKRPLLATLLNLQHSLSSFLALVFSIGYTIYFTFILSYLIRCNHCGSSNFYLSLTTLLMHYLNLEQ